MMRHTLHVIKVQKSMYSTNSTEWSQIQLVLARRAVFCCQDWTWMSLCNIVRQALLHRCMTFVSEITSPMLSIQRFVSN